MTKHGPKRENQKVKSMPLSVDLMGVGSSNLERSEGLGRNDWLSVAGGRELMLGMNRFWGVPYKVNHRLDGLGVIPWSFLAENQQVSWVLRRSPATKASKNRSI